MQTSTITQTIKVFASNQEIYNMWLDSKKHSDLIVGSAEIDPELGGEFSIWDGVVSGKNIELIPFKKIVQEWRYEYENWPADFMSKITLDFEEIADKTIIHFTHENIPQEYANEIEQGWEDYYWKPLRDMFN